MYTRSSHKNSYSALPSPHGPRRLYRLHRSPAPHHTPHTRRPDLPNHVKCLEHTGDDVIDVVGAVSRGSPLVVLQDLLLHPRRLVAHLEGPQETASDFIELTGR